MAAKKGTTQAVPQPDENTLKMVSFVQGLGLNWAYRSFDALTSTLGVSRGQLRMCAFQTPAGTTITDVARATRLLIAAGWVKTAQDDINALAEKAYDVLEQFRELYGSEVVLHSMLVQQLTDKHFFMNDGDINKIGKVGEVFPSVTDLATAQVAREMQEMIQQVTSYSS